MSTVHLRRLLGRTLAVSLLLAPGLSGGPMPAAAQAGPTSPPFDPLGGPNRYALARSDQLLLTKIAKDGGDGATYGYFETNQFAPDLSKFSSTGTWRDSGADMATGVFVPVRGRFTDAQHDQALLLNEFKRGPDDTLYVTLMAPPGSGPADAPPVPKWQDVVDTGRSDSPVAVASGDLDGVLDADGFPHDEAVVATVTHPDSGHRLWVQVLDYNVVPGQVTMAETQKVEVPPTADGGKLAVATGDFDGDGQNEIAVAWEQSYSGGLPFLRLAVLRYTRTGTTASLTMLDPDVSLPPDLIGEPIQPGAPISMAVGDFDGRGRDQLAISVYGVHDSDGHVGVGQMRLGVMGFDSQLHVVSQGNLASPAVLAQSTGPQVVAGVFRWDEAAAYGLNRKELALSWAGDDGKSRLQVLDVSMSNADTCGNACTLQLATQAGPLTISNGPPPGLPTSFVSLATGGFRGLSVDTGQAPQLWGLAAAVTDSDGSRLDYFAVNGNQLAQTFSSDERHDTLIDRYIPLAYDPAGASVMLGPPAVFTISNRHVASMIIQDPPKHADWFYDPQQHHGSFLNVDRSPRLNVTTSDSQTTSYTATTTNHSDWTIGASGTASVTASVKAGVKDVSELGGRVDGSVTLGGSYQEHKSAYDTNSSSVVATTSGSTSDDDLVGGTEQTFTIYRFPILGRALTDTKGQPVTGPNGQPLFGFYEISVPGKIAPIPTGGGRAFEDWYQPLHENGNVLSYPQISNGQVPVPAADLGPPVTLSGSNGRTLPQPLLNKSYMVDPTGGAVTLQITGTTGSGSTTDTNSTISESEDVDAGLSASWSEGLSSISGCVDLDIKANNSKSWGTLSTAGNTTTSTNTFVLSQDSAALSSWAYAGATAYYTDKTGAYKVVHAVDLLASTDATPHWKKFYGGKPDPALNLPNRIDIRSGNPEWNDSDSRQQIRGFFVLHPDDGSGSVSAAAPFTAPRDGDKVQLRALVHNYSLDTPATNVLVKFVAQARDPGDERNVGQAVELGSTTVPSIAALGVQPADLIWDTSGRAPVGQQLYRIFVIVAPNDPKNPSDPNNEVIHAWQDRYNEQVTRDGTTSTDPLIDPLTGQKETLEAGQNKQGWGEVIISARQAPPMDTEPRSGDSTLAAAASFGSGGIQVSAPTHGGLTAGRGLEMDRSQDVRVHVNSLGGSACGTKPTLQVFDGDPDAGGTIIADKPLYGLAEAGADGRWASFSWVPRTPGQHRLVARLVDPGADAHTPMPRLTTDVDVAEAAQPPAMLDRLAEIIGVVWLPGDLRTPLVKDVQAAQLAASQNDQAAAHAQLAQMKTHVQEMRGKTLSGHDAERLLAVLQDVQAQPTLTTAQRLPAAGGS